MMVWQDQVSGGPSPKWTRLAPDPRDADWPDDRHAQFMLELERMIDTLENHPSIVVWVPFNESWGQHRTMEVGAFVARRDPTRLLNIASGGNFWPVGDIVDDHKYPHPGFSFEPARDDRYVMVMGEFGGHGYPVPGNLWDAGRRNWGYGDLPKTEAEYKERYATSIRMLNDLRRQGIAAGVYTQTTDVEGESERPDDLRSAGCEDPGGRACRARACAVRRAEEVGGGPFNARSSPFGAPWDRSHGSGLVPPALPLEWIPGHS